MLRPSGPNDSSTDEEIGLLRQTNSQTNSSSLLRATRHKRFFYVLLICIGVLILLSLVSDEVSLGYVARASNSDLESKLFNEDNAEKDNINAESASSKTQSELVEFSPAVPLITTASPGTNLLSPEPSGETQASLPTNSTTYAPDTQQAFDQAIVQPIASSQSTDLTSNQPVAMDGPSAPSTMASPTESPNSNGTPTQAPSTQTPSTTPTRSIEAESPTPATPSTQTQSPAPETESPPTMYEAPSESVTFVSASSASQPSRDDCSPQQVEWLGENGGFHHKAQEARRNYIGPPVFSGDHKALCSETLRDKHWQYCLPIRARKDEPFCSRPDRTDLLSPTAMRNICFSSVLHMLLVDVYETFASIGGRPALLYGTLLGAVRNGSMIPFTEDTDLGYLDPAVAGYPLNQVQEELLIKGYHMFQYHIWRVCVAPTHPLAGELYSPSYVGIVTEYDVPYVDLYKMRPVAESNSWHVDEARYGRLIPKDKFEPFAQVKINDRTFDTVADPVDFLLQEYGSDYLIPKPRGPVATPPPEQEAIVAPAARTTARPSSSPTPSPSTPSSCSQRLKITPGDNSFYQQVQSRSIPPPTFSGEHNALCTEELQDKRWKFCLPIIGRKDEPFCSNADRTALLDPTARGRVCFASVLHMLLVDVYETLAKNNAQPILLYGTMLGAVRNSSIIPFTEDTDIGYLDPDIGGYSLNQVREELVSMGYHMFQDNIGRVCVAPTHPLAGVLYSPSYSGLAASFDIPYADLYVMRPVAESNSWQVASHKQLIPKDSFEPFSQVRINDRTFNTVADPIDFLLHEYGSDYMTPKPRGPVATPPPDANAIHPLTSSHPAATESATVAPTTQPPTTQPPTPEPTTAAPTRSSCSPQLKRVPDGGSFYQQIQSNANPPPIFSGEHEALCTETLRAKHWQYCLPMTGRKDEPFCTNADRTALLSPAAHNNVCFASVLHMLLVDVYETLEKYNARPILLYGTMLGAVRSGSMIPFTEDTDIGYLRPDVGGYSLGQVREDLIRLGYHMFEYNIWRVCVAPNHPLAGVLYTPSYRGIVTEYRVPYVDMYSFRPEMNGAQWQVDEARFGRRIPKKRFEPFTKVKVNNREFDTVADPVDFLTQEYGYDYMTPKPRSRRYRMF